MNDYRKAEGVLYRHFRKQKKIGQLEGKLIRINNRINRLKNDIKTNNIELHDTMRAIDYSGVHVQTSDVTSGVEKELEKAIELLVMELKNEIREKRKTESRIRNLTKQMDNIAIILDQLTEEEMQIVELKYSSNKTLRQMQFDLFKDPSTIKRKIDKIVEYVSSVLDSK